MSENLGPAVTDDFPQVVGLQDLMQSGPANPAATATTPPPAPAPAAPRPEIPKDLAKNALTLIDSLLSRTVLQVDPEPAEIMQQLADALTPLLDYYSKDQPLVVVLWTAAVVALSGYGYGKYAKVQQRKAASAVTYVDRADTPAPAVA